MANEIGTFESTRFGTVTVVQSAYLPSNNTAIMLYTAEGEPLAKLSVNLPESNDLDPDTFYVKHWGENEMLWQDAHDSGLFNTALVHIPPANSGHVTGILAWSVKEES